MTKMNKEQILEGLTRVFNRWQELLPGLHAEQLNTPVKPLPWTIKDIVAHMWAWQQISIARMQAAVDGSEPRYPEWRAMFEPDPEENVDRANAWIYQANRDRTWSEIYRDWQAQFQRYIEQTERVSERDLLERGRYAWMGPYALADSCLASIEHHQEHFDAVRAWLEGFAHGETDD